MFPEAGLTKLDLVRYYLAVADGALRGVRGRPMILKRFVKGIHEEAILQKRAPEKRPGLDRDGELKYRSGTSAEEIVVRDARRSRRSSTSAASTSTPTRCGPRTSTGPTSCGSTSTRCPASRGGRSSTSRTSPGRSSPTTG